MLRLHTNYDFHEIFPKQKTKKQNTYLDRVKKQHLK